ncbi:MAG: hypothetical protein PW734_11745 [Verrucomicrobium sp.]|nr:hypothetical protein [Verrucomicrobium sp.]
MRALILLAAVLLAAAAPLRAEGGSVGFQEDAVPQLKKAPGLLDFVRKTLEVEDVGWAVNGGRTFTNRQGVPVLPYGFRAKPKGQHGAYTVLLVIEEDAAHHSVILNIAPVTPSGAIEGSAQ